MPFQPAPRTWYRKFADSFRGLAQGVRGEGSFAVHFAAVIAVVVVAGWLRVSPSEWCLLTLAITVVLAAEMFNTSLERLARAVDGDFNPHLEAALNIASAAVLICAGGAVVVGSIVFVPRIVAWFTASP